MSEESFNEDELLIIDVDAKSAGTNDLRLDHFLSQKLSDFSRSRIQKLIADGHILVNDKSAKPGVKLKGGERITVAVPPVERLGALPENIEINIVFQDDHLAVIDKPAGMVTHPGAGVTSGTLVNALLHHMAGTLSGISGVVRPGIVHRLDKDTSGLLVIAKNDLAHRSLAAQIHDKQARRVYIALLEGIMQQNSATIEKNIGRHPSKRKQMAVIATGRRAVSHYRVLKHFSRFTLVEVVLETGRTHQIRVHMASIGYPVVGDLVYNSKATGNEAARRKLRLRGQALHAFQLSFRHPCTGVLLEFEAPLPADFKALLESLT